VSREIGLASAPGFAVLPPQTRGLAVVTWPVTVRALRHPAASPGVLPAASRPDLLPSKIVSDDKSMPDWDDYQEETAEFFRSIGLEANTNVTINGIRTSHDVDVVVRSNHVGFDLLWLVECKHWKTPVSKLYVLALREIVSDTGADRGILMAEKGFQSGALEAAQLTNVQLTSLADLKVSASHALGMAELRVIQERVDQCRIRYWRLSKDTRIKYGLRQPFNVIGGYTGVEVLQIADYVLNYAFSRGFPIIDDGTNIWVRDLVADDPSDLAKTPVELIENLEPLIADLEQRLDAVYAAIGREEGELPQS
jgi:restriction system protein